MVGLLNHRPQVLGDGELPPCKPGWHGLLLCVWEQESTAVEEFPPLVALRVPDDHHGPFGNPHQQAKQGAEANSEGDVDGGVVLEGHWPYVPVCRQLAEADKLPRGTVS